MLYDEGGAGAPILLLHGLMGSARTWAGHLDWLRGHGHVYTFDAAGHGRPAPPELTTEAFVADLAEATAGIGEPMAVIGHSMGGLHGWVFAAHHPERVRALVVEDIAPDFTGRTAADWAAMIESWPQPFPDADAVLSYFGPVAGRYFLNSFEHGPQGYRLHGSVATFRDISEEWGGRSFWAEWRAVRVPALLIEGEHTITPPGQMREMAAVNPHAEYVRVAGAGHLVHDEQPRRYRVEVARFLDRVLGAP
ncbi:alpha/beta fold hydrolase [Nocardia farcinica]|uniref:Esterase ybfF n=1 Tax=Nocardia farcinica TaxID=37329 RepID=A0A0H5PCN2_NOCFR|nr:alpha/beta fold hydrolase [Nocardia farcinica]AXK86819.1 alpha/beta hydrolase [Nocardia farcinica]MBA4855636.1 alpha/beta fold hydrolase [Nocardia farcinica]MBC9817295.1 alpha/beta fold hydrolase [Nocardia farcinica]CRY80341.1 Esterase ybfF [Nocardia farcinica]SIT28277.1 Pimeloyl-ACP methyl ester carboxylesterase [Nocardia farcinica]